MVGCGAADQGGARLCRAGRQGWLLAQWHRRAQRHCLCRQQAGGVAHPCWHTCAPQAAESPRPFFLPHLPLPQFVRDVGDGIVPSWAPIVERRRGLAYTEEQRQWQLLRRGRRVR